MSKTINQAIAENQRLYLLYGEEQYLLAKYAEKIVDHFLEDKSLNYEVMESLPKDKYELSNALNTLPFFSNYRVLILKHLDLFASKDTDMLELLHKELESLSENTVLIIWERKIDKKRKLYKLLQKNAIIHEQNRLEESVLIKYLQKWFERQDQKISPALLSFLIRRAGDDLEKLIGECEKIRSLDEINQETISILVPEQLDITVFYLTDAISKKDRARSIKLYRDLLKNREPLLKILIIIANRFQLLLQIRLLLKQNYSASQIGQSLGLYPKYLNENIRQANLFKEAELKTLIAELMLLDWQFKQGKLDLEEGLELFLIKATQSA